MQRKWLPNLLLTAALVFVFGWFGIDKLLEPLLWIGWMPRWMDGLMGLTKDTWLIVVGITEMCFAILLLIPVRKVRMAGALLMVLHLFGVIVQLIQDSGWSDIAVRDIAILLSGVALLSLL